MRRFYSYGPIDREEHYCVARKALREQCAQRLIGHPVKGGHYFTIWAPRQTGKTWLMQEAVKKIQAEYHDQFVVGSLSMQNIEIKDEDSYDLFLTKIPYLFYDGFRIDMGASPENWENFQQLFDKTNKNRLFDKPLILFIDEFDMLPGHVIDRVVRVFRDIYLKRGKYLLHGLALLGVRAVLGIESPRGSPFNIQQSLHVPNFTLDEVKELYQQYQTESGQSISSDVIESVYMVTNGQPGLVSWFGELLSETYNPGRDQVIGLNIWKLAYHKARFKEPNNTIMNLVAKAKMPEYQEFLLELFSRTDRPFAFHEPLHNYLYLHGILDSETIQEENGALKEICRFTSPFVQECLYDALSRELVSDKMPILALDPLDDLAEVFEKKTLQLPALLRRYKDYLARLKAKGINPWKDPPRRKTDLHLTEAVGHFHLYMWLQEAIGTRCVVSPEFPTGNGKVDIHLRCGKKHGIIEVKSFVDAYQSKKYRTQAAQYARSLKFGAITIAMFVPLEDETVLEKLSGEETVEGIQVTIVAIGWT